MTPICKKCSWNIDKLDLPEETLLELWFHVNQGTQLFAVKQLKEEAGMDPGKAKGVVAHFNAAYGKCHRCNYSALDREYMECPKCAAFNYNLNIEPPFNKDFCAVLEYKLDFSQLLNENIKGFWCDGIDHFPPDIQSLSTGHLRQKKYLITKAWLGESGQELYEATIHFGPKALDNYIHRKSLNECIPEIASDKWIEIDPERRRIDITLN